MKLDDIRARFAERGSDYIALATLCLINLFWFQNIRFRTLMGDDLVRWQQMHDMGSVFGVFSFVLSATKYRPVNDLIHFVLINILSFDHTLFLFFNILLNCAVLFTLYTVLKKVSGGKAMFAFGFSLAYITSRFAYWNVISLYGILESLPMLMVLLMVYCAINFAEKIELRFLIWTIVLYLLVIFTDERYIVLLLPIVLLIVFFESSPGIARKVLFVSLAAIPLLANLWLKWYVFHVPFLQRDINYPIDMNVFSVAKNFFLGLLNILGVNIGPDYLNLIGFTDCDMTTMLLSLALFLGTLLAFVLAARRYNGLSPNERNWELKLFIIWGSTVAGVLLSGSVAGIIELRWIYPAFVLLLIYLSYLVAHISERYLRTISYAFLFCFLLVSVKNDLYYRGFLNNYFYVTCNSIADSVYDRTVGRYGTDVAADSLYVKKFRDYNYIFQGNTLFFKPYLESNELKIHFFDSLAEIRFDRLQREKTIILVADPRTREVKDVTPDAFDFHERQSEKYQRVFVDFIRDFPKGNINSDKHASTPNGRGAFTMVWEPNSLVPRNTLTILSGYAFTYTDVTVPPDSKLVFNIMLPYEESDGARAFIAVSDGHRETRLFNEDILPPGKSGNPSHKWRHVELPLHDFQQMTVSFTFGVESPTGNNVADWIAFDEPAIVQ